MSKNEKLNILYISSACSEKVYKKVNENLKTTMHYSIQKFHNLIIKGISSNNAKIHALCGLPINRFNTSKIIFRKEKVLENDISYHNIGFINLPIIKQINITCGMIINLIKWIIKNKDNENKIIICDASYVTVTPFVVWICKKVKIKKIAIVADIYGYMSDKLIERGKIGKIKTIITKLCTYCWNNYDGYILLTEQMNDIVNPKNKPYMIMEGIVDKTNVVQEERTSKNYILYAGSLYDRYGIKELVDGFSRINNKNIELHLYGKGESVQYINSIEEKNPNVKYKGSKPNEEILKKEEEALLLINPRPTTEEYTKYSFPSKTLEYMLTGTPVLMTKLPGMPEEYYDYIYIIEDETAEGIKNSINRIFDTIPEKNRREKGKQARDFVLKNKNNEKQGNRIVTFIHNVLYKGDKNEMFYRKTKE